MTEEESKMFGSYHLAFKKLTIPEAIAQLVRIDEGRERLIDEIEETTYAAWKKYAIPPDCMMNYGEASTYIVGILSGMIDDLRIKLSAANEKYNEVADHRDLLLDACHRAVKFTSQESQPSVAMIRVGSVLRDALAGDSPDPWTYVTDDDASLPPVGEEVVAWSGREDPWDRAVWTGERWSIDIVFGAPRNWYSAWMRVQPPNKKETPNAL